MKQFTRTLLLALPLFAASQAAFASPALISNSAQASLSLSKDDAKAVLLGKRVTLGSDRVTIVIIKNDATQDELLQGVVGMSSSQFQNHWRRLFMTGGGSAPKIVGDEAEAIEVVTKTAGAIAIVDDAAAGDLPVLLK